MRLILLDGLTPVAEFGFLRLDTIPKTISFDGEVYVFSHPLTRFDGPRGPREVVGFHYQLSRPLKLRPEDRLRHADPLEDFVKGAT